MDDEKYYQEVIEELRGAPPRESLWLKAMTLNDGNEHKARIQYVKWRVDELVQQEHDKKRGPQPLPPFVPTEARRKFERGAAIFGRVMLVIVIMLFVLLVVLKIFT